MRVLDLFCGAAGGWSLGLHRAGFSTVAACEIDGWRREVFHVNNPRARMYADVRDLTALRIREDLGLLPSVVVGSPPCQDISAANHKGRGLDGERTGLFSEAVRLVREIRPLWFCFENSPRLRTGGIDRLIAPLEGAGYACWPLVVGARCAGAPHRRDRVWLLGVAHSAIGGSWRRPDLSLSEFAAPPEDDPHPHRQGEQPSRLDGEMGGELEFPGHPDRQRLAVGEGVGGDASAQLEALERAVGAEGARWNGGPARHFGVADGIPPGLARKCVSAYGDAVVPAITEAIGRAVLSLGIHTQSFN